MAIGYYLFYSLVYLFLFYFYFFNLLLKKPKFLQKIYI